MTASSPAKVKSQGFNLRLTPQVREALEQYRKAEGHRSVGEVVREMISRGLAEASH